MTRYWKWQTAKALAVLWMLPNTAAAQLMSTCLATRRCAP